ncbi:hypothetical protein GQF61_08385 [Sphingobacterium sp. DK4209]|mgnify:CR=1 FL=1|uniref:DUF2007 domain-containing protein n=1 Tax=Sphingobacterium zhuxiongii TaxID=2662364 RepID=A0A5Q0QJW4_9SPHI|nr:MULTISPECIES: DUF2007 domain-containing protein [unclassified Sphingobacterium]MVZ65875.1 hypothetical protein [Sphingobacterium sp. DK4209]QGA28110.1 hypothetical protein GFH32_18050 [Sphingobacterium sp. dk4302]
MNSNWTKVKVFTNQLQAEIVKQMLVENNIPAVVLNKQDSSYHFGVLELYVDNEHTLEATALIDSFNDEDEISNEN